MAHEDRHDAGDSEAKRHVRTLFISDVHMGMRAAQVDVLLEFLKYHDTDTIYLVGDIIDGWKLKSSWYWPQSHDEFLRPFCGMNFGGIDIAETAVHIAADGRRYLVMHGDAFDVVIRHARWLALLGDWAYDAAIWLNRHLGWLRRQLGYPYWSLSNWAKARVKNAVSFIGHFEATLAGEAKRQGMDGVICGHIHSAAHREIDGIAYLNTGDWVESCTALVEHVDGRMEIINWAAESEALNASRAARQTLKIAARSRAAA